MIMTPDHVPDEDPFAPDVIEATALSLSLPHRLAIVVIDTMARQEFMMPFSPELRLALIAQGLLASDGQHITPFGHAVSACITGEYF
jgi:hypothetical protein